MAKYQIKCINKPHHQSPVEHITHVGGFETSPWRITVEECMRMIEAGNQFVVGSGLYEARVFIVQQSTTKRKHIRTVADQTKADNLLTQGDCAIA